MTTTTTDEVSYSALLPSVIDAVEAAGARMLAEPLPAGPRSTVDDIAEAIHAGDATSLSVLRTLLMQARPGAGWVEDELDAGVLPDGEWWITDPVEGAINRVHGLTEWAVTATLIRNNVPVLTAVHLPTEATTYTAVRGSGAYQDGATLVASLKTELHAALVGTGQASPRETTATYQSMGRSITAMLAAAGVVRVSVPATLQLIHVAAGRTEVFWQHSAVRSGLVAGALLIHEAGGVVTDLDGQPWTLASTDFLAAAPALHSAAAAVLRASR